MIIDHLGLGGAQTLLVDLLAGLDRKQFDPLVCSLRKSRHFVDILKNSNIRVVELPGGRYNPIKFFRLVALVRRERPAIVHTHLLGSRLFGVPAARFGGVGRIFTHEHSAPEKNRRSRLAMQPLYALERLLMHLAEKALAVTEDTARFCIENKGFPREKVEVIHNWIDPQRFHPRPQWRNEMRKAWQVPSEVPVIGSVGRLNPVKGHRYLVEAAPHLLSKYPDMHFVIIGEGEELESLRTHASRLGVVSAFRFPGFMTKVEQAYAGFDLFVLPSVRESFGLVVLEAMAAGCPIIATDVGGVSEIVEAGRNGLLARPGDPVTLAAAIDRLLKEPHLASHLADAALKDVGSRFSRGKALERLQECYRGDHGKKAHD